MSVFWYKKNLKRFLIELIIYLHCMLIVEIFHMHGMKIRGVGYDEKYDDDMEIWSLIALARDCLEPIKCRVI